MLIRALVVLFALALLAGHGWNGVYPVVDTSQSACFGNDSQIDCPTPGQPFNGQDGQYLGNPPRYVDNGNGTVSDLVTGLMWVKERGSAVTWREGMDGATTCAVGGYRDWRAPTIKELYSLMNFNGWVQSDETSSIAYIDTRYFDFKWGDTRAGLRIIDCQDWSSTVYKGTTMGNNRTAFGVNFADGRIKGYPIDGNRPNRPRSKYMRYVRGNPDYGQNDFHPASDGTVTDRATGLIWQQVDDGTPRNWEQALAYCENLTLAERTDWRLPSAKELHTIVDYERSPSATDSAAIDPVFTVSDKEAYYWTSTTHLDGPKPDHAAYFAFGRAMGWYAQPRSGQSKRFMDVHGAGAQRSDPKSGDPSRYPQGHGPQGDDIRIDNLVRCVTGGGVAYTEPRNEPIPAWKGNRTSPGSRNMNQQPSGRMGMHDQSQGCSMNRQQDPNMGQQPMGGTMHRGGPPPEAFTVCEGLNTGDACTVQTPRGTLNGLCRDMPDGRVCVPERE